MALRIDKRLNLVVPIEDEGSTLYVHSMPISREVFDRYCRVIARTFRDCYVVAGNAGVRIAANVLREVAEESGVWEDGKSASGDVVKVGVKNGLMAEIKRLTNVVAMTDQGWGTIPYDHAVQQGKLDPDTAAEVESLIVFFTVASWMHRKQELPVIYETVFGLWNARTTSLNCTEWGASLPTSTATDNSGKKEGSSVPS
jgi:hypothetical protein